MELVAALLIIGAVLLLLETVLPGMIAGILGFCCLVAGIYLAYANFGMKAGNGVLIGVLAALIVGTGIWLRYFPESKLAKPFVSQRVIGGTSQRQELVNKTGTALTNLRPSGTALIDGKRVDVVTEGPMVSKGTALKVVQVEGLRVVVRSV